MLRLHVAGGTAIAAFRGVLGDVTPSGIASEQMAEIHH